MLDTKTSIQNFTNSLDQLFENDEKALPDLEKILGDYPSAEHRAALQIRIHAEAKSSLSYKRDIAAVLEGIAHENGCMSAEHSINYIAAKACYEKADHIWSYRYLARLYYYGNEVPCDPIQEMAHRKQGVLLGDPWQLPRLLAAWRLHLKDITDKEAYAQIIPYLKDILVQRPGTPIAKEAWKQLRGYLPKVNLDTQYDVQIALYFSLDQDPSQPKVFSPSWFLTLTPEQQVKIITKLMGDAALTGKQQVALVALFIAALPYPSILKKPIEEKLTEQAQLALNICYLQPLFNALSHTQHAQSQKRQYQQHLIQLFPTRTRFNTYADWTAFIHWFHAQNLSKERTLIPTMFLLLTLLKETPAFQVPELPYMMHYFEGLLHLWQGHTSQAEEHFMLIPTDQALPLQVRNDVAEMIFGINADPEKILKALPRLLAFAKHSDHESAKMHAIPALRIIFRDEDTPDEQLMVYVQDYQPVFDFQERIMQFLIAERHALSAWGDIHLKEQMIHAFNQTEQDLLSAFSQYLINHNADQCKQAMSAAIQAHLLDNPHMIKHHDIKIRIARTLLNWIRDLPLIGNSLYQALHRKFAKPHLADQCLFSHSTARYVRAETMVREIAEVTIGETKPSEIPAIQHEVKL